MQQNLCGGELMAVQAMPARDIAVPLLSVHWFPDTSNKIWSGLQYPYPS